MGTQAGQRATTPWTAGSDGRPQVFYHGTRAEFSRFSKDVDPNFDTAQKRLGFFFADDPRYARKYAKGARGQILCVQLAMRNPKIEPPLASG